MCLYEVCEYFISSLFVRGDFAIISVCGRTPVLLPLGKTLAIALSGGGLAVSKSSDGGGNRGNLALNLGEF